MQPELLLRHAQWWPFQKGLFFLPVLFEMATIMLVLVIIQVASILRHPVFVIFLLASFSLRHQINCYYISFQDMQLLFSFFSVIYHFKTVLNDLGSKLFVTQFFLSEAFSSRINSCYTILFSNLIQRGHNIIISRVISSHIVPMYIETLYT